ncbi:MAG: hypothetical protein HZA89_02975 [Verrucomicrobia bacterium]|nr:hypothetical protein [Verrucomicrobiota bacterium]
MKFALFILGALLVVDAIYFGFSLISSEGYEDVVGPIIYALLFGLPVVGAFIALLCVHLFKRKR